LALSGRFDGSSECPLLGVKRLTLNRKSVGMVKFSRANFAASFANLGIICCAALSLLFFLGLGLARDLDGKYANSPLQQWFDSLASRRGPCCSVADGQTVEDVDWDTKDGRYRVRLDGQWIDVPPDTLITVPNKFGLAVVWLYKDYDSRTQIRCFIPGAGG
jgi:hypothetical protein